MKKLLATTAVALVAMASTASAQSVLERVLSSLDAATSTELNGTFANIAENIGNVGTTSIYVDNNGDAITTADYNTEQATLASTYTNNISTGTAAGDYNYTPVNGGTAVTDGTLAEATAAAVADASAKMQADYNPLTVGLSDGVNGSITNLIDGLTASTEVASVTGVTATEWDMPTLNFGDMATTALGAVNTGNITLGVNSKIDNAKTTSTQALSTTMEQLGGSSTSGALVLNIASNMTGVNGSITNTMEEINGTVGKMATTALGAVNTGTIISGVNASVQGITGTSGTPTSGQSGVATTTPTTGG